MKRQVKTKVGEKKSAEAETETRERAQAILMEDGVPKTHKFYIRQMLDANNLDALRVIVSGIERCNDHEVDRAIIMFDDATLSAEEVRAMCVDVTSHFDPEYDGGSFLALLEHLRAAARNPVITGLQIDTIRQWLLAYNGAASSQAGDYLVRTARENLHPNKSGKGGAQ